MLKRIIISLEIKLIDFEAAKKLSQDFQVDIATPGFTNDAVCNYEQQDWYAFAVIVHRLFVPICPLYYLAPSLLFCQDYMVQKHFGNEAVSFLRSVRSRMLGLTPLLSHGPFIDKALQACDKRVSLVLTCEVNILSKVIFQCMAMRCLNIALGLVLPV